MQKRVCKALPVVLVALILRKSRNSFKGNGPTCLRDCQSPSLKANTDIHQQRLGNIDKISETTVNRCRNQRTRSCFPPGPSHNRPAKGRQTRKSLLQTSLQPRNTIKQKSLKEQMDRHKEVGTSNDNKRDTDWQKTSILVQSKPKTVRRVRIACRTWKIVRRTFAQHWYGQTTHQTETTGGMYYNRRTVLCWTEIIWVEEFGNQQNSLYESYRACTVRLSITDLFCSKKNGSPRLMYELRNPDDVMVKDVYPVLWIDEYFDKVGNAFIF